MESVDLSKDSQTLEDKRDTPKFWQRWIALSRKAAKRHWIDSRRAWREDDAATANRNSVDGNRNWDGTGTAEWDGARYPIWWASNQIMKSAFYSRTPETYARRVFGIDDPLALTQTLILERLGRYAIETGEFDCAMKDAVADWLNSDKTTTQVCATYSPTKKKTRKAAIPGINPNEFLDAETNQPVSEEILLDSETNSLYYEIELDEIQIDKIYAKCVPFDHILHTPSARTPYEIQDMAYYFCFTKEEAIARFGEERVKEWPPSAWKKTRTLDHEDNTRESNSTDQSVEDVIEGWEIWSKVTKKVYWYCPDAQEFLDEPKEDPYKLKNFFPSPNFAISTKPSKSLYPTPVFTRLWPTIDMFHVMYGRVFNLIDAARRRALVNGDDDLVAALNNLGDSEFVAAQNMLKLVTDVGLDNLVWYIPVQDLVNCIGELNQQDEKFKANFAEWRGIPDILRGASDPIETAAAVEQKVSAAHDRFKNDKKMFADLARDTLEIMIDMYLYLYDDEKIAAIVGYSYMQPESQQNFLQALTALRNDQERTIRIEIETDTTSYLGEQIRIQQRNAAITTVVEGLSKIQPMLQDSPQMAAVGARVIQASLEGSGAGRLFVDDVKRAIDKMIENLENPPPPPPPPPDYAALDLEIKRMNAETNRFKVEGESMKTQMEQMRKDFELQLKQQQQEFEQYLQNNYLQLESVKTQGEMENKDADNSRLEVEAQAKVIEAMQPKQESNKEPTTVIINQAAPSPVPEVPIVLNNPLI